MASECVNGECHDIVNKFECHNIVNEPIKNMTDGAYTIMAFTGRNILYACKLDTFSLYSLDENDMAKFNQVHDVMAHLFVNDVVAFNM
jgi:hypothetical protein